MLIARQDWETSWQTRKDVAQSQFIRKNFPPADVFQLNDTHLCAIVE